MAIKGFLLLLFFIVLGAAIASTEVIQQYDPASLDSSNFSRVHFTFGAASASYQYEGAVNEGGRKPSIWDTFTKEFPEKIADHSSGVNATNSYYLYKEDVRILKDIGFGAYRFSISWSRVVPSGKVRNGVNREGIRYYNNLINEILSQGMEPFVTLFHWDAPQALQDEYLGFLSPQIVNDFQDYAELCYKEFGDRVKNWITLNEPDAFSSWGHANGLHAPGRCSKWIHQNCTCGDSGIEPYIVAHHLLLAHAAAVKVYRKNYQILQKGRISITLNSLWYVPLTESKEDKAAADRALDFKYGWFIEPLTSGSYPASMIKLVNNRLPQFTDEQALMVKGSFDFLGLNYYTTYYAADVPCQSEFFTYMTDSCVNLTTSKIVHGKEVPIGPQAAPDWLYIYPKGLYELLLRTKHNYGDPVIYITENGVGEYNGSKRPLKDTVRIKYYASHLKSVQAAMKEGVKVRGYFAWSLLDNFEWGYGFTVRFGLVYVDFQNDFKRIYKHSARWFKRFLNPLRISID